MNVAPRAPIAVIDLGTNTVLMLIGRSDGQGGVQIMADQHAIGRLGQGVDAHRRIRPEALVRVCAIMQQYAGQARQLGVVSVRAFGTSALRDATNRQEVCDLIQTRTGIELSVVDGMDEARLTHAGAGLGMDLPASYAVLDIGGGSTEIAVGSAGHIQEQGTVNLGAVRCTERFLPVLPPATEQVERARAAVERLLARLPAPPRQVPLIGVAGTVTTLGAIDRNIPRFDADELNGHVLTAARVRELSSYLLSLNYASIRAMPQVNEQRADLITAGALILHTALSRWKRPDIIVSTRGMRYGLLWRELGRLDAA